jgi:hypothetical protein
MCSACAIWQLLYTAVYCKYEVIGQEGLWGGGGGGAVCLLGSTSPSPLCIIFVLYISTYMHMHVLHVYVTCVHNACIYCALYIHACMYMC